MHQTWEYKADLDTGAKAIIFQLTQAGQCPRSIKKNNISWASKQQVATILRHCWQGLRKLALTWCSVRACTADDETPQKAAPAKGKKGKAAAADDDDEELEGEEPAGGRLALGSWRELLCTDGLLAWSHALPAWVVL